MVEIQMPKPYTSRVRNALAAAPESVDLRNLGGGGGAFFSGGIRLDGLCVRRVLLPPHCLGLLFLLALVCARMTSCPASLH